MCRGIHWPSYGPVDPCQIKILWTQKSSLPAHSSILAHSRLCSVIHVQSVSQDRSAFLWVRCVQSEDAYMPFCISARPCYLLCSQLCSVVVIVSWTETSCFPCICAISNFYVVLTHGHTSPNTHRSSDWQFWSLFQISGCFFSYPCFYSSKEQTVGTSYFGFQWGLS